MGKLVSKSHSKHCEKMIQSKVPITFYWKDGEYDGYEFYAENCNSYERKLLNEVIKQLEYIHCCQMAAEYMRDFHNEEWRKMLEMIDEEKSDIPKAFIDAFKNDDNKE